MPSSAPVRARPEAVERVRPTVRKRGRDPLWAKLLVVFGALLMMGSGGVIVGGRVLISVTTSSINQSSMLGGAAVEQANGRQIDGPLNILLVGLDERTDKSEPTRSDSIIILHVPASHDQAYLVSIPRDLYVQIPAHKTLHPTQENAKINAAFSYGNDKAGRDGGVELLAATLKRLAGVSFNAAAIVNFAGFRDLVDAMGGVEMCLDLPTDSEHIGRLKDGSLVPRYKYPKATPVYYNAGCQHLEGWQALDYCRQRYKFPNGDYDRARHQQQFIKAVLKRAKDLGLTKSPTKALQVIRAGGKALTLDTNNMEIADWAFTLRNVTDNAMVMLKMNAGKFNPVTLSDGTEVEQLSEESKAMLAALRDDRLAEFVMQHPDFVASDTAG